MHSYWGAVAIRRKKRFLYRKKQSSFLQLCLCSESNTLKTILVKPCLHCQGKFSLLIKQAKMRENIWERCCLNKASHSADTTGWLQHHSFCLPSVTFSFLRVHCYQMGPGRFIDSFVCIITDVSFSFLCSEGWRLSNFNPANMSHNVHNCLNTSCRTGGDTRVIRTGAQRG